MAAFRETFTNRDLGPSTAKGHNDLLFLENVAQEH